MDDGGRPTLRAENLEGDFALGGLARDPQGRPLLGGIPLLCRLGRGGMGIVYYAVHPRLGREIAVKILPRDLAERDADLVRRFLAEARLAASLDDPHLVRVLDVDQDAGTHYYLMEYVGGESAGARLRRGPIGEREAVDIACAATRGLAAAHAAGIVHRDVKPDNILIPDGDPRRAKLADLGLAKPMDASGTQGTRTGVAMGTPGFMAPEQAEDAKRAEPPADVFAMGATLYALLAGRPPFDGPGLAAILRATALEDPPPLADAVGEDTRRIVQRCMRKSPADRFAEAGALLKILEIRAAALAAPGRQGVHPAKEAYDRARQHERRWTYLAQQGKREAHGEREQAVVEYGKVLEIDPESRQARLRRGELLLQQAVETRFTEAEALWEGARGDLAEALRRAPQEWGAHNAAGNWARLFADAVEPTDRDTAARLRAEAKGHFDRAVELAPASPIPLLHRGRLRTKLGDLKGALQDFGRAIELEPRNWVALGERAGLRGLQGDFQGAVEDYTRGIALAPWNAELWEGRANARLKLDDPEKALGDFASAFDASPERPGLAASAVRAGLQWADRLQLSSRFEDARRIRREAEQRCDLLLRKRPEDPDLHQLRGHARYPQGNSAGALADYARAAELRPRDSAPWEFIGNEHNREQNWDLADAAYTEAIERDPSSPDLFLARAAVRLRQERRAEALADLQEVLRLQPANGMANLAIVHHLIRTRDPAARERCDEALRRVAADDPMRPKLEQLRAGLR